MGGEKEATIMKNLKRSLLFMGLCLMPVLVFAAANSPATSDSTAGQGVALPAAPADMCTEATTIDLGLELVLDGKGLQDCAPENGLSMDGATPASMERKPGCKSCPNQPWCGCTYQGYPRISCDPCCYYSSNGQIVCLS
jgi:hypothetical protein